MRVLLPQVENCQSPIFVIFMPTEGKRYQGKKKAFISTYLVYTAAVYRARC